MVVSDIENPHFAEMVHAAEDDIYRQGYRVLLCNTGESDEKQRTYLEILAGGRALGVIIAPCDPSGAEIGHLMDLGFPVVAFDRPVRDQRADAVLVNNADAARLAVEHLLTRGYQRIGYVGISPKVETAAARLAGYKAAMAEHGLEPVFEEGGFRADSGMRAAVKLLGRDGGIDAIVTGNNMMAIDVLRVLRSRELSVPEDIGLVTFDDPYWAELLRPSLTCLAQPIRATWWQPLCGCSSTASNIAKALRNGSYSISTFGCGNRPSDEARQSRRDLQSEGSREVVRRSGNRWALACGVGAQAERIAL